MSGINDISKESIFYRYVLESALEALGLRLKAVSSEEIILEDIASERVFTLPLTGGVLHEYDQKPGNLRTKSPN